DVVSLCARCLAPDPQNRQSGPADIAAGIARSFATLEERARAAEIAAAEARARALQERRARRLTIALASSVLLFVLLGLAAFGWLARERELRRSGVDTRAGQALEEAQRLLGRAESTADLALFGQAA